MVFKKKKTKQSKQIYKIQFRIYTCLLIWLEKITSILLVQLEKNCLYSLRGIACIALKDACMA
jgi:hypothetical protein